MRTKIFTALVVGGLLVGAGFLSSIVSTPDVAQAQEENDENEDRGAMPRIIGFLGEVLGDLVDEGTITQDQSDAIVAAAQDKADELREEHPHRRGHIFKRGFRLGALLDDGGIDQEEYDSLDGEHPMKQIDVSEYLEDGLITRDEFREILSDFKDSLGNDA